jgi:hypothetical protein
MLYLNLTVARTCTVSRGTAGAVPQLTVMPADAHLSHWGTGFCLLLGQFKSTIVSFGLTITGFPNVGGWIVERVPWASRANAKLECLNLTAARV